MTKLQGPFRIRNRQYFEKRVLPGYSTGFKVPETRGGANFFYFFKTLLDGQCLMKSKINRWLYTGNDK